MAIVSKRLCKGTLGTTSATLYTVPALTLTVVKAVTLCNITAVGATVTLAFAETSVIHSFTLNPYDTVTIPFMDQVLHAGEVLAGHAGTASAITYYISGKEDS